MKRMFYSIALAVGMMAMYAAVIAAPPTSLYTESIAIPAHYDTPAFSDKEVRCVQRTVFGEARNQSYATQVAVAASIVNRSLSGNYANDLCAVAAQTSQYQGYSGGVALGNDIEAAAWDRAFAATDHALFGYASLPEQYRLSMFFHQVDVKPAWSETYEVIGRLDSLIFYTHNSA
jgi:N-acetylmuramoyl-L-alanine amidase